jgi:hypothetical protein
MCGPDAVNVPDVNIASECCPCPTSQILNIILQCGTLPRIFNSFQMKPIQLHVGSRPWQLRVRW